MIASIILNVAFNLFCSDSISTVVTTNCYYEEDVFSKEVRPVFITEYEITNDTSDVLFSWFNSSNEEESIAEKKIHSYFFKRYGDFYLFMLLTDNVVWDEVFYVDHNIIKCLKPNEKFKYIFISKNSYIPKAYIKRTITIVNEELIKDVLKIDLTSPTYNWILFQPDHLVIER